MNEIGVLVVRLAGMLGVAAATALTIAPAAWLADFAESRSPVRLVYPSGTVWNGSAGIAVSDGRRGHVVPGLLIWQVNVAELATGRLAMTIRHETAERPVRIFIDWQGIGVEAGELRAPAALLSVFGAPFNTLRPGGTLHVQWDNVRVRSDGFEGNVQLDWLDAQSALSAVAPLGNFRLTASGRGGVCETNLTTLSGPLLLQGRGSIGRGGARFNGTAQAQPQMKAPLDGLVGLLGRRSGDQVQLTWEAK
jgi:general secretion pathway protein N